MRNDKTAWPLTGMTTSHRPSVRGAQCGHQCAEVGKDTVTVLLTW